MSYWRNAPPIPVPGFKSYLDWLREEVGIHGSCRLDGTGGDIVNSMESAQQLYARYKAVMEQRINQAKMREKNGAAV